ncbi:4-formylbenzenesulfonate dehydrogenase TsaC1/TsaC2 [Streptomyces sp. RB5]|uniref:4-formylbenzenesulfonate dehydrogenase TsaC1/TsaC2 n=1 Tax=Streptomyces smaragdinus TaxID=2585196 RepID=A0A7K0CL48_9ACTN|nr:SDR family oxidoreductase [Streptomyces smaragdinus]MQY14141.1 4-formylbenzenesulfonate dehydrogenase TsaC1/TsaC2 [Streptomyces smaragdinus]
MDLGLTDKVVAVTAASRGIGAAVARRFAAEGATVVAASRSAAPLEAPEPGRVLPVALDLDDTAAVGRLVPETVAAHGRLDVLVVNTPGPKLGPFLDSTDEDWLRGYDLLLRPAVQLARAGAKQMAEQGGGCVVFLTSTWVRQPAPGGVLSSSFRSAIAALAKQLATEVAPLGVRVVQVQPGATGTDRMRDITVAKAAAGGTTADDEVAKIVRDIPLGRWASADEIADTVAFLASPRSSFTTGASLAVDGGAVRSLP